MAAGIVYHDITTASGVTFSLACWVPDTGAPDVGAVPVSLPIGISGAPILPSSLGSKADAASLAITQSTEDKAVLAALSAKLPATLGSKADAASLSVTQSTEDKAVQAALAAILGVISGSAVVTDANGTLQQYLRGIVSLVADTSPVAVAGTLLTEIKDLLTTIDASLNDIETQAESATAATVQGDVAHDAADAGSPTKIGGKAIAALSGLTLPAAADRVNAAFDLDGALIVRTGGAIGDRVSATASNTDGSSTACITAQGANIKVNLTDATLVNMHASQTIYVEIKDGSTTKWVFPVPALGGVTHRFETPLTGTANTAWNFDPSAATTTIYCSMSGRLSKV